MTKLTSRQNELVDIIISLDDNSTVKEIANQMKVTRGRVYKMKEALRKYTVEEMLEAFYATIDIRKTKGI